MREIFLIYSYYWRKKICLIRFEVHLFRCYHSTVKDILIWLFSSALSRTMCHSEHLQALAPVSISLVIVVTRLFGATMTRETLRPAINKCHCKLAMCESHSVTRRWQRADWRSMQVTPPSKTFTVGVTLKAERRVNYSKLCACMVCNDVQLWLIWGTCSHC